MQSKVIQKWQWKIWLLCVCMMIAWVQVSAQSFMEALERGQAIKLEWIQQELKKENAEESQDFPLFPDELQPGESEIRVGLNLKSIEGGQGLVAEVAYINYLAIPEPEEKPFSSNTGELLPPPIILDTRFQDQYFDPQLFLLDALTQEKLPIACSEKPYQQFLNKFAQQVQQSSTGRPLLKEQLEWLERSSLPSSLSASSLATFFCQLMEVEVPKHESPVKINARKEKDIYRIDYLQVNYPDKMCMLKGQIQSPASEEVRVKFFKEGDWLEYWQDSILQLDKEGNFQFSFSLDHPRTVTLFHGYKSMRFYLEPGDTLQFSTDANAFYRKMKIEGTAKAENEFLLDFYHEMRGDTLFRSYDFDLLKKEHSSYFQKIQAKESKERAFLSERSTSLRSGFRSFMDRSLKLEYASTQWEAASRFMAQKRIILAPVLLQELQQKANLLYRLPQGKTFDFNVEEFLIFQFYLLQNAYQGPSFGSNEDFAMAQLLPSKATFVRHSLMQIFRSYGQLGKLTESRQWQLSQLIAISKDTQLIQEMSVFAEGKRNLAPTVGYRTLQKGKLAPIWSFTDKEGVKVALENFANKKLLLHIGWVEHLDNALTDIQSLQETQDQLPEIVHLLAAPSKDQFYKRITGKEGLFVYLTPEEMEMIRDSYYIDNKSNHYFLIGEDGKILANHYDLGTARKLRGAWEKVVDLPPSRAWTAERRLQFWQGLGIVATLLLLISGIVLWQRRIAARREERRRQVLEIELRGIRSQMNPHFLFNAMSSIQNLIRKQEQEKADLYLGQFAGLMRKTLRNTAEEYIPLTDEVETLQQYCSLESLRTPFQYEFLIDESIDAHNTYIPSMILQPIIENAIIHGLGPQTGTRELLVEIAPGKEGLNCNIMDNGIGILASQKHKEGKKHQSLGMKLVRQRLTLMGLNGEEYLAISDRSTLNPPAQGTLVSLTIPVEQ